MSSNTQDKDRQVTEEDWLLALDNAAIKFEGDRSRWPVIVQKLMAARHQLSKAINLYLSEMDFLCAITLSGAAYSLLREMLKNELNLDPLGMDAKFIEFVSQGSNYLEKATAQDVIRGENYAVNWLKHKVLRGDDQSTLMSFDDQEAAFNTIESTLCMYRIFTKEFSVALSPECRESFFGSPQIVQWQNHWGDDNYFE